MAGGSCHCLLSPFTDIGLSRGRTIHGHKSTEFTFFGSSLLKEKYYLKIIVVRAASGMNALP